MLVQLSCSSDSSLISSSTDTSFKCISICGNYNLNNNTDMTGSTGFHSDSHHSNGDCSQNVVCESPERLADI